MMNVQHAQLSPSACGVRTFGVDLPSVRPSERSSRPFCACASTRSNQQQQQQLSRRQALGIGLGMGYLLLSSPAYAARGLDRYIKKKGLDPIDTYVPPVLQARDQLLKAGEIMGKDAEAARTLLREGAFDGLRDNIRALGEYAVQNGSAKEAPALVKGFFVALETYDRSLFTAIRYSKPVEEGIDQQLQDAVQALDRVLETVPAEELSQAQEVMRVIREKLTEVDTASKDSAPASDAAPDSNLKLFLPKT